jgi:CRP-like cAMP-binding protein
MPTSEPQELSPLLRKLDSIIRLSDEERDAVKALPVRIEDIGADQDIVCEGDRPRHSFALLDGFCATYSVVPEGRRQIMAFHIPGDMPDLQSLHLEVMDNSIGAVSSCRIAKMEHSMLQELCIAYPRVAAALWRESLITAGIFRRWLLNIGRREAYPRLAHFLCEMMLRMRAVGLADDYACAFPITQAEIGDALGLSTVHVNRTLQEIREAGLVEMNRNTLKVLDWDGLQQAGDFDPTYLHIKNAAALR